MNKRWELFLCPHAICWLGFDEFFFMWVGWCIFTLIYTTDSHSPCRGRTFLNIWRLSEKSCIFKDPNNTNCRLISMVIEKWIQYRKNNSRNRFVRNLEVWELEILFSFPYRQRIEIALSWSKNNFSCYVHVIL